MAPCIVILRIVAAALCASFALALVDESGRYQSGAGIESLAPPEPTAEDRSTAIDLSKQPIERIFRLLAFELMREEKRAPEKSLGLREFQDATEVDCPSRLVKLLQGVNELADEIQAYHLNITGTVGLYWLLHQYPEEHSWVWLVTSSHERLLWKIDQHLSQFEVYSMDERLAQSCLNPGLRTVLMNAAAQWRKIYGDYIALLWNGVAFGMLGDVTSWRELDNETLVAEEGPGGPPPNASWSENIIFGNMWMSSVQKWLDYHRTDLTQAIYTEIARLQAGMSGGDSSEGNWLATKGGSLSSFEYLRRQVWAGWELDKGLLRGLLRHVLQPDYSDNTLLSVADFGTNGGKYSAWLNDTGLVQAFSFDSTFAVGDITGGVVQHIDSAANDAALWRSFDWIVSLDFEWFLRHSKVETPSAPLLRSLRSYATRGFVTALPLAPAKWSPSEADFVAFVEAETGMHFDARSTETLRRGCEVKRLSESVVVFRIGSR
eukprot:TRINITY_DN14385_c0_g2_i1.p1 TRINITY_DN14385_c0_g2~~TRINITY_DN14385_c0_g2_i1.p1  ORF type:complete len:504 (+),score=58.91 TRINITY_DN14385_c0_g2_i1:43-1512(+)